MAALSAQDGQYGRLENGIENTDLGLPFALGRWRIGTQTVHVEP